MGDTVGGRRGCEGRQAQCGALAAVPAQPALLLHLRAQSAALQAGSRCTRRPCPTPTARQRQLWNRAPAAYTLAAKAAAAVVAAAVDGGAAAVAAGSEPAEVAASIVTSGSSG